MLPNEEGLTERYLWSDHNHSGTPGIEPAYSGALVEGRNYRDVWSLWLMASVVLAVVLLWRDCPCFNRTKECLSEKRIERITEVSSDIASMTMAWAGYFGMLWFLDTLNQRHCSSLRTHFNCGSGGMTGSVLLALCCTLLAYLLIIIVRYGAERKCVDDKTANVLWHDLALSLLKAQGLLIGFSWEKSFDLAVEDVSDKVSPDLRQWYRVGVSSVVCVMVGLVWKLFLLPQVMHFKKEDEVIETARKVFKMPNEKRGGKADGESHVKMDEQNDQERTELAEDFKTTMEAYLAATKREYDKARDGQAQRALDMLSGKQPPDGMKAGQRRAQLLNQMKRVLRRYEEIEVVEEDRTDLFQETSTSDPAV